MASGYEPYGYRPYGYGYGGVPYSYSSYIRPPYLPSYPAQGRLNPMYSYPQSPVCWLDNSFYSGTSLAPTPSSLSLPHNTPLRNISESQHLSSAPVTNSQQPFNIPSPVTHFVDGEATGHIKPLPVNPGLHYGVVDSPLPLNINSSVSIGNGNAQSPFPFEGSANQSSENVQGNLKNKDTLMTDPSFNGSMRLNADDFPSLTSSQRVSSVVNAMCNLSEVLLNECFNNGSCLKIEQLEKLDNVVDNISKCLKKITSNKTVASGEASLSTHQSMDVSCPNVVNLNEALKGVGKDFQGFSVNALESLGFKKPVDSNEIAQSIKDILTSEFPDGEETNPQTLLYKKLWIETEAAFLSTTCMTWYHKIKNEFEIFADTSTFVQEPSLNLQKSVPIMNNAEQEITETLIKNRRNCEKDVVTKSDDTEPVESPAGNEPNDDVIETSEEIKTSDHENNTEALEINRFGKSRSVSNVDMRIFQMMKRRKAEQLKKSLNNNFDRDSNSDSDSDSNESSGSAAGSGGEESSNSEWEEVHEYECDSVEESTI